MDQDLAVLGIAQRENIRLVLASESRAPMARGNSMRERMETRQRIIGRRSLEVDVPQPLCFVLGEQGRHLSNCKTFEFELRIRDRLGRILLSCGSQKKMRCDAIKAKFSICPAVSRITSCLYMKTGLM